MLKRPMFFCLILTLSFFCYGQSAHAKEIPSITYHVSLKLGKPGQVGAVLEGASGQYVTFSMVSDWTTANIVRNILSVEAIASDGSSLPVTKVENGWRVSTFGQKKLTFRYCFGTSLVTDWGPYEVHVTNDGAFFLNSAIFVYPDTALQKIQVIFDAPDQWTVGTSFIPEGNKTFRVEGIPDLKTDLLHNVTRLGVARAVVSETCGDREITFIDYGPLQNGYEEFWQSYYGNTREEQMHEYIQIVCDSIQYFESTIGDWPGGSRYWISTFATGDAEVPTAWARWMQAWPRERYSQVPHHVLHAWVWWGSDAPIRFGAPEWMWVHEGVPTFYEKVLTPSLTGNTMWRGMSYTNYLIVKRAAQFDLLEKTDINKYAYGEMRALAMDRAMRQATDGAKSIGDLLRLLYERFGRERQQFSREELIQAIDDTTGTDFTRFYNRYFVGVVSSELPPVDAYLIDYQDEFLEWAGAFVGGNGLGNQARGSRTMFFVSLEIAIQVGEGISGEHYIATGCGIYNLQDFETEMNKLNKPITKEKVISVLSSITGVSEDDFFDFYTIGKYSPSVEEIKTWVERKTATCLASSVTSNSATLNGIVNPNGAITTYYFEYGTSPSYGSETPKINIGSGTNVIPVAANLTGLNSNTIYYYRIVATNNSGTIKGGQISFITLDIPCVEIEVNGQDGPIVVSPSTPISVDISLAPGQTAGQTADWWIAVHTPFSPPLDWYTYVYPTGWLKGINLCVQTGLFDLSHYEVLNMTLPVGNYIFYFAVDDPDRAARGPWGGVDSVEVTVQ